MKERMDRPIYDINDNLLNEEDIDLEAGYLTESTIEITVPAAEAVEEEWHYEYEIYLEGAKEGGLGRWKVIDVPGVEACDEHQETIPCYRYLLHSAEPEVFEDPGPTQLDRVEAQALYTAIMTDTLLETEIEEELIEAEGDVEGTESTPVDAADNVGEDVDGASPSDVNDNEAANVEGNDAVGATDVDTTSETETGATEE